MSFPATLALGAVLGLGDGTSAEIKEQVDKIFQDKSYAFCHDEGLILFQIEREYCELVGKSNDVCPALPKVCKNKGKDIDMNAPSWRVRFGRPGTDYGQRPTAEWRNKDGTAGNGNGSGNGSGGGNGSGDASGNRSENGQQGGNSGNGTGSGSGNGSGSGSGSGNSESKPPQRPDSEQAPAQSSPPPETAPPDVPPPDPPKLEIPSWLGGLFRILFYVLAAAFVGAIVYFIVKNLMKGKKEEDEEAPVSKASEELVEEEPKKPTGPVETDVDRLLARARAAAARGDYKAAIEDAYAALLRRLEGDGLLDLHPSRTNGDYVRSLRERAELKGAVRNIATDVESVQFGSAQPNPTLFDSVYRRVLPLVGRTAAVLVLLLGLGQLVSCDAQSAGMPRGAVHGPLFGGDKPKGGAAAGGLRGIVELLAEDDVEVTFDRPEDGLPEGRGAVVLMPGTEVDKDGWRKLKQWLKRDGGILVLAGWREELAKDFGVGFQPSKGPGPIYSTVGRRLELSLPHTGCLSEESYVAGVSRSTTLERSTAQGMEPYAMTIDSRTDLGSGRIVVLADDRLFANIALTLGDNAAYLHNLFEYLDAKKVNVWDDILGSGGPGGGAGADGESEGGGAESPMDSIKNAHLLPIVLQLAGLVLLFLIYRGTRFQTPKDPREESRRAFADHTRALGMTYARADATRHATSVFSVWALDRLRERLLGSGRRGGLTQLAEAISARTGRPIGEVMQVLVEASGLRDEVAPPSSFRSGEMPPPGAPQHTERSRNLWIMQQLDSYLVATTSPPKGMKRGLRPATPPPPAPTT